MAAAINLFCSRGSRLWRKHPPFHKLLLQRPKKIHTQINSCASKTTRLQDSDKQQIEKWIKAVGKRKLIWRPLAFTVMTGAVTFTGCAILQYETVRQSLFGGKVFRMSSLLKMSSLKELDQWWKSLLPVQKTVAVIIALNTVVLLLWKIPNAAIQSFMLKWFVTCPAAGSTVTLLTSSFSHMNVTHLVLNMIVLWSLAPLAQALLGREQFLAFYITAGVFASCASNVFSVIMRRSLFQLSLGASGGIIALASFFCIYKPDLQFAVIFLPFLTFPGGLGLLVLVGVDLAGVILRWQIFDHAAHLGGVLFGACYLMYGHKLWDKRSLLQEKWHKLRNGSRKS